MELCEGGELSKLLQKQGTLSNEEASIIMQRLTDAVSYLHKKGTYLFLPYCSNGYKVSS